MSLWLAVPLVVISMALQDIFATALVISEGRNLGHVAGLMDAANDYVSRVGSVITAGVFVRVGLGNWRMQLVLVASALTSYVVTRYATGVASRLLPKGTT